MTTTKIGSADWRVARREVVALDLGSPSLAAIRGRDARRFCNGMFTNNIRALAIGATNRSAIVDDRARIGGFLSLMCLADDHFLALLDDGIDVPAFLERYERYIVFDDVTIEASRETPRLVSLQGPRAADALASLGVRVPEPGCFFEDPIILPQNRSNAGGYDLIFEPSEIERITSLGIPLWTAERSEALRILTGRPRFPTDTGDKRLPHELSLRDEMLSFDKGCYIGQETINRVDVMGQVKRALTGVRIASAEALSAGALVSMDGDEVGTITSVVLLPDGDALGLAVLKKPADIPGTPLEVILGEQRWQAAAVSLPLRDDEG